MAFLYQIALLAFIFSFARLAAKDMKNGIYAVLFLLPLYLVRFSLAGIPITVLEIMIYVLSAVWLYKNGKNLKVVQSVRSFYESDRTLAVGIFLLFLGVILSMLHSSDLRTSLGVLKGWFVDPFLFFIIFTCEIKNQKQTVNALMSFVLSGFVVALVGMGYALNNVFTFDGRLRAFYESPNYLAMYLSPAFLFAVYLFVFEKESHLFLALRTDVRNLSFMSKLRNVGLAVVKGFFAETQNDKAVRAIILLSLSVVILLTKSYGAVLGIAAALFCFLLKKYRDKNAKIFSDNKKSLTLLAVVMLIVFSFLSVQKYEQLVNAGERSSLASRFIIWNASLEILQDSPVFGIGPGTFQKVYLDYQSRFSTPYLEWAVPQPHNTLLAFCLQSGLIGFIGFVLILFWLFRKARINDVIFIFLVYFLIHGLVDALYWKNDLAMIFWLLIGIGFSARKNSSTH